jgi:Zn-finger nucleic acid-binding protein
MLSPLIFPQTVKKAVATIEPKDNKDSLIPSPICEDFADKGVTPVSKNTRLSNRKGFFLDCDSTTELSTTHGFTPLPNVGTSVSKSSTDRKDSVSPDFSLNIKPQLSWNIAEDDQGETPVSLGSNISANFWGDDAKSPSAHMLVEMTSPASLSEGFLEGNSSPISVFFEGGGGTGFNQRKQFHPASTDDHSSEENSEAADSHEMTPLPPKMMPLQSPYFHGPHTPHSSMNNCMNESRDDMFSSMEISNRRREGAPSNYNSPRPMFNPTDRVVNLRGQISLDGIHSMQPLPPHIPSHHHFLTSPIGSPGPRHMIGIPPSHHHHLNSSPYTVSQSNSQLSLSKNRCIPLKHPIPNKFQGDMEKYKNALIPDFPSLVNYPSHMSQKQSGSLPDGMRCCVMCGQACRCSVSKPKKGMKNEDLNLKNPNGSYAMIPTQNKGLCTSCDVNVWIVLSSNLEIKWCKGCKNFRPWAAFGDKGLATKCVRCRDRQREKYAAQKEEKDRKKPSGKK